MTDDASTSTAVIPPITNPAGTSTSTSFAPDAHQTETLDEEKVLDKAFVTLVRGATEEFGFAPRDVYDTAFNLPDLGWFCGDTIRKLDCSQLKNSILNFRRICNLDYQEVIAMRPTEKTTGRDTWTIGFKSTQIVKKVVNFL